MQGSSAGEGGAYNTVNLNLYNYGNNNPVKYSDPDGNWVHIAIGAAIGGAIGGISAAFAGGSMRDVVAATVGGIVTGGLAAATCGASLGTAVAGSAMASTIGYLAENIVAGRDATVEGVAVSAAGGATGAMAGAVLEKGAGIVASKIQSATKIGKSYNANQIGKAGEDAVRSVFDIGGKPKISINGRNRIPDGLNRTALSEVKNVKKLSFTQQLHDFYDYAEANGLEMNLYIRSNTALSKPLREAINVGKINSKIIPE